MHKISYKPSDKKTKRIMHRRICDKKTGAMEKIVFWKSNWNMLILCRNKHVDEHHLYLFHRLLKTEYALPQAVKILLNVSDETSIIEIYCC